MVILQEITINKDIEGINASVILSIYNTSRNLLVRQIRLFQNLFCSKTLENLASFLG